MLKHARPQLLSEALHERIEELERLRILNLSLKSAPRRKTATKTTRKAATMRFVVSSLVLDCIKGSYTGVFRGFNLNHVILSLKSKLHFSFTNVPLAVH